MRRLKAIIAVKHRTEGNIYTGDCSTNHLIVLFNVMARLMVPVWLEETKGNQTSERLCDGRQTCLTDRR